MVDDRLIVSLDFLVNNAIKAIDLVEKRISRFGTSIQKMGTRKLVSMSDAIESSFGKTVDGANQMGFAIQRASEKLAKMERPLDNIMPKTRKVSGGFRSIDDVMKGLDKRIAKTKKGSSQLNQNMLQFGLSALFTGMAIKNFSQSIIRNLSNSFMTLADESSVGVKRTLELQAAVQFLKFVLFDTFARTELYASFVSFVVRAANAISEFVQTHPGLTKVLFVLLGIGIVLGSISMVIGQVGLGFLGIQALMEMMSGASFLKLGLWTPILVAVALIAGLLFLANKHLQENPQHVQLMDKEFIRLGKTFDRVWGFISRMVNSIGIDLPGASKTAFAIMLAGLKTIADALEGLINSFSFLFQSLDALFTGDFARAGSLFASAASSAVQAGAAMTPGGFAGNFQEALNEMKQLDIIDAANRNADSLMTPMNQNMSMLGQTMSPSITPLKQAVEALDVQQAQKSLLSELTASNNETNQTLNAIKNEGMKLDNGTMELFTTMQGFKFADALQNQWVITPSPDQ